MELQHARARTAVSARTDYRTGFNLAFLFVLVTGVFLTVGTTAQHDGSMYQRMAVSLRKVVAQTFAPPPVSLPSAFEVESAMAQADLIKRWDKLIAEASKQFNISRDWIRAVIHMESGGRTMTGENQPITSQAGAMGLMQLMPETYAEMRAQYGLGADPYNPRDNVFAGTAYLRLLYQRYGNPGMFAAYNDGPGKLEDHLYRGRPLPAETRHYVSGIAGLLGVKAGDAGEAHGQLARLTRPNGSAITIDRAEVRSIRAVEPGEYADGVKSVVLIGKKRQGIRETVGEVTAALGFI
jgi:hypothetical protein